MRGILHRRILASTSITTVIMILTLCSGLFAFQGPRFGRMRPGVAPTPAAPSESQPPGKGSIKMRVEEGMVTADVTEASLQDVLRELAERTGVVFEVRTQENPTVSIHIQNVPLPETIQRIASGSNLMFEYGQGAAADRITIVHIYPRTVQVQQPSLLYLGTGVVTKNNNMVETPEQALQILTANASIEDKEKGIEILTKAKSEAAVKALTSCMTDPAPEIRAAAIEGLAAMGSREAMPNILKSLKDEHPGVRQSAITAIALLGDMKNVRDLRPLTFDKDASVAGAAEIAVRKLSSSVKK